jgi:glucokinase
MPIRRPLATAGPTELKNMWREKDFIIQVMLQADLSMLVTQAMLQADLSMLICIIINDFISLSTVHWSMNNIKLRNTKQIITCFYANHFTAQAIN